MTESNKIQPRPTNVSAPFWEACREDKLRIQQCQSCANFQFYPRIMCSHCGSRSLEWQAVSGQGKIASFTVVRRGVSAAYEGPYVVALIDLDEGPRMMSQILTDNPDGAALRVGAPVTAIFENWSEETKVALFELDE